MSSTLLFLSIKALTNKQKSILCGLSEQFPNVFDIIVDLDGFKDKMRNVFDCIDELYYNQIQNRYPDLHSNVGVTNLPLIKCCLMNQSIWVVQTGPLTIEIMPINVN